VSLPRILVPAENAGRELARRRLALGLLTALPLAFYGARAHHPDHAAITGGIAMAFSIAGASIFAALTAREADQRLVLAGYRPYELLLGRLLVRRQRPPLQPLQIARQRRLPNRIANPIRRGDFGPVLRRP
jgi:hypothetical protein